MTAGIYRIWHRDSDRSYIGQSINCVDRVHDHFYRLKRGTHLNFDMQATFDKFGKDAFEWEIVDKCPSFSSDMDTRKWLLSKEKEWIPKFTVFTGNHAGGGRTPKTPEDRYLKSVVSLPLDLAEFLAELGGTLPGQKCFSRGVQIAAQEARERRLAAAS